MSLAEIIRGFTTVLRSKSFPSFTRVAPSATVITISGAKRIRIKNLGSTDDAVVNGQVYKSADPEIVFDAPLGDILGDVTYASNSDTLFVVVVK